uniref:Uncharacterized protein n=1 Tax=Equus caballus TaxID=9796 RepID=A0A3Q2GX54_HORSE
MRSQDNHQHIAQELLVLRIHMQLVTVQLTQLSKGSLEVVHVLNSISKRGQHLLAMGLDFGIAHYGRGRGQVAKVVKKPLGPGIDNQEPMRRGIAEGKSETLKNLEDFPNTLPLLAPPPSSKQFSIPSLLSLLSLTMSSSKKTPISPILLLQERSKQQR